MDRSPYTVITPQSSDQNCPLPFDFGPGAAAQLRSWQALVQPAGLQLLFQSAHSEGPSAIGERPHRRVEERWLDRRQREMRVDAHFRLRLIEVCDNARGCIGCDIAVSPLQTALDSRDEVGERVQEVAGAITPHLTNK